MVSFTFERRLTDGPVSYKTGISDLMVLGQGADAVLYVASGPSGGVSAYALGPGGPQLLDRDPFGAEVGQAVPGQLAQVEIGGTPTLVALGRHEPAPTSFALDGAGRMVGTGTLDFQGGLAGPVVAMETLTLGGTDLVYTSHWGSGGVVAHAVQPDGSLAEIGHAGAGPGVQGGDIVALEAVNVAGQPLLLSLSAMGDSLTAYRIAPDGQLVLADTIDPATGLWVDAPTALATAELAGVQYAIVAAAGSDSLSVLRVGADGGLTLTDHVVDNLDDSRFGGVTDLEAITVGDQVFLVAGGADDGLSLFSLLPGGRLLHRAEIADSAATGLQNVSTLALHADGGTISVFAGSQAEAGITHLTIDPGPIGATRIGGAGADQLTGTSAGEILDGGAGDDEMNAGAGDDILIDGAGSDRLWGGAGADIFVLTADGQTDTVMDFEVGVDRLDLSGFGLLRSLGQLSLNETASGAAIRFGTEEVELIAADGQTIDLGQLAFRDLVNSDHYPVFALPEDPPKPGPGPDPSGDDVLTGTVADDLLRGYGGNDHISGMSGNDTLEGGDGSDSLYGGAGHDLLMGGAGNDMLMGEDGNDVLSGEDGDDTLSGNRGDDWLFGGAGHDRLEGDDGTDTLYGSLGEDFMLGGAGNDSLYGEQGHDLLAGQDGNDLLSGEDGNDLLYGDGGDDWMFGGLGDDRLDGGAGADNLFGSLGDDLLTGGAGNDMLMGEDGADVLSGDDGNDTLAGNRGDDWLFGGLGDDRLDGGDGVDNLYGSLGDDLLAGGAGNDTLTGEQGADVLSGDDGDDRLFGNEDDDWLFAGAGNDWLEGGDGTDTLYGSLGEDFMLGGAGTDTLFGEQGHDLLAGQDGADVLSGDDGNDLLYGDGGDDWLFGGLGDDRLDGGAGNDNLFGSLGDDLLAGGAGNDALTGEVGSDTFVFADGFGQDTITDFEAANPFEKIDLSAVASITGFSDLTAGHVYQSGANVVIDAGGGNTITLWNTALGDLGADDFLF